MWHVASHCHFVFSFVANFKKSTFTSVFCVCSSGSSSSSSWRNHVAAATPTLPGVRVCVWGTHTFYLQTYLTHTLTERGKESNTNSRFELPLCRSPRGQKISFFFHSSLCWFVARLEFMIMPSAGHEKCFRKNAKQNWAIEKLNRNGKMFTVTLKWH